MTEKDEIVQDEYQIFKETNLPQKSHINLGIPKPRLRRPKEF